MQRRPASVRWCTCQPREELTQSQTASWADANSKVQVALEQVREGFAPDIVDVPQAAPGNDEEKREVSSVRNAHTLVEVFRVRLSIPGTTAAGGLSELQDQVRFHRRNLLHARVWRSRVGEPRSAGSGRMTAN